MYNCTILSLQKFQLHFAKLRPNRMPQVKRITCDTKEFAKYQKVLLKVYEKKTYLVKLHKVLDPISCSLHPSFILWIPRWNGEKIISEGKFLFFTNMHLFEVSISSIWLPKIAMPVQNPPSLHITLTKGLWVEV